MKVYKITKIEKDQKEVTVELSEAQFLLLQSLVADGEDYYSSEETEDRECLDEPLQECYSELYEKIEEVL